MQQAGVLFIDLFVYGSDGKPTWFTAAAYVQASAASGHTVFAGDLYQTNGPSFAGPFDTGAVVVRKVGTLTFDADTVSTASLTYSVDGTQVAKIVTRQTWATDNFTGEYYGGFIEDDSSCTDPSLNGHYEQFGNLHVTHTGNSVTLAAQLTQGSCTFSGTYSQEGHMGRVDGNFTCTSALTGTFNGTFTATELEKTISGMTGRYVGRNTSCQIAGRIGGLRR